MSGRATKAAGYAGPLLALFCAWLPGCAVGPNYERPAVNSPAVFRDDPKPRTARLPRRIGGKFIRTTPCKG